MCLPFQHSSSSLYSKPCQAPVFKERNEGARWLTFSKICHVMKTPSTTLPPPEYLSSEERSIDAGTIFGVHRLKSSSGAAPFSPEWCQEQALQPGRDLLAAGYALYSSATMLVISLGNGAHGFTLQRDTGTFYLTHPDLKVPKRGAQIVLEFALCANHIVTHGEHLKRPSQFVPPSEAEITTCPMCRVWKVPRRGRRVTKFQLVCTPCLSSWVR